MSGGERTKLRKFPRSFIAMNVGCAAIFGLPFFVVGVVLMFLKVAWFVPLIGLIFAPVGAMISLYGLRGILRRRRKARLLMMNPDEPWLADHHWNESGTSDRALWKGLKWFPMAAFIAGVLVPFNYWMFFTEDGELLGRIIVGGVDLIPVAFAGYGGYLLMRYLKYGSSSLRFKRFPFLLGETLEAEFIPPRAIRKFEWLEITLRCVEERFEMRRGPARDHGSNVVVCYQIYADSQFIAPETVREARGMPLRVTFELPDYGRPTELAERPPIYWEIVARAKTPGVDYRAVFLVPVYAKPKPEMETT